MTAFSGGKCHEFTEMQPFTTMALPATARFFCPIFHDDEIVPVLQQFYKDQLPIQILGGGSNTIFLQDFPGLVLQIKTTGIEVVSETAQDVVVRVAAGENWDSFVKYSLQREWFGLENLAAIPGTVGAAPVQNIGAYGREVSQFIERIEGIDLDSFCRRDYTKLESSFSYRDSIFKKKVSGRFLIQQVLFRLNKKEILDTSYPDLKNFFNSPETSQVNAIQIANAIRDIRSKKLPAPEIIPNSGSFFQNPEVTEDVASALKERYPEMPLYNHRPGYKKIAAAWLIEFCGWKGRWQNHCSMYDRHALILIHDGHASGKELYHYMTEVIESVFRVFQIELVPEVNMIGRFT